MKTLNKTDFFVNNLFASRISPFLVIVLTFLLCYGFEIFNFNITIDEEIHTVYRNSIPEWAMQGRWGIYLLSFFIPTTVVPVVSVLLGLILILVALWYITKYLFDIDDLAVAFAVSLAITVPTLPFILMFSTIAYAIGVGFIALLLISWFFIRGIQLDILIASFIAGFAISIYQPFIFSISILIVMVWIVSDDAVFFKRIKEGIILLVSAIGLYFIIDRLIKILLQFDKGSAYTEQFIDLSLTNFNEKILRAVNNFSDIILLSPAKFGIQHPWLVVFYIAAIVLSVYKIYSDTNKYKLLKILFLFVISAVPVGAEFLSSYMVPIRSQIYMPIVILVLAGLSLSVLKKQVKFIFMAFILLLIVNNSIVSNHLFASSSHAYELDSRLAGEISQQLRSKFNIDESQVYKLEVVGYRAFNAELLTHSETFGGSFFTHGLGERYRIAAFLRIQGVSVVGASDLERLEVAPFVQGMPAYPNDGWILVQGNKIVLKFGDYSVPQQALFKTN